MTEAGASGGEPRLDEIRDALRRILTSDAMGASPQLSAFLSFVVDAVLSGNARQINGYTIAVEALGRADNFDPRTDSIVRVVAGRLRRALEQYYAEAGAEETIVIDLPLGSYIPVFRRAAAVAQVEPVQAVEQPAAPAIDPPRRWGMRWTAVAAGIAAVLALVFVLIGTRGDNAANAPGIPSAPRPAARRAVPTVPLVYVQPFEVIGAPPSAAIDRLRARFSDALARFDAVTVVVAGTPSPGGGDPAASSEYRFAGTTAYNKDGTITLSFRLIDSAEGIVLWTRSFEGLRIQNNPEAVDPAIVREVAATVASPFGAVWAHEISSHTGKDVNRACEIKAIEYWRGFDPALHEPVRQCLERMVVEEPDWAPAQYSLAMIYLREFYADVDRPGEPAPLDRALKYARNAVELKPRSARAHHALFAVLFARGEIAMSFAAAERAMVLNPYDTEVLADYGGRLVSSGQIERGMTLLNDAVSRSLTRPVWAEIYSAIGAYLAGDMATASRYAAIIGDNGSPQGLIARAMVANANGEADKARQAVERLTTLNPAWRTAPARQLAKFFPDAGVRNRISHDLQAAGLQMVN